MLGKITDKGGFYTVKHVPVEQNFRQWRNKFTQAEYDALCAYITERLADVEKFSVGTHFGGNWGDTPLHCVYKIAKFDEKQASYLLGLIVMDLMIRDVQRWCCTKTNLTKREFETNFYWKEAA